MSPRQNKHQQNKHRKTLMISSKGQKNRMKGGTISPDATYLLKEGLTKGWNINHHWNLKTPFNTAFKFPPFRRLPQRVGIAILCSAHLY